MNEDCAGGRVFRHGTVDSTSERAFAELAAGRARHLDVHVATGQTQGRGRHGRAWRSPPGTGLYASFVLLPERPWNGAALTMALGLACLDVVRRLGLARAMLKWPNDLVEGGAKLAGVLAETRDLDPRRPAYVAGIGINVSTRDFPADLVAERPVTSLASCGLTCDVEAVLAELADTVPRRTQAIERDIATLEMDFVVAAGLADRPMHPETTAGARVRAEVAAGPIVGALVAFSVADGLRIRTDAGVESRHALEHVRALARCG